MDDKMEKFLSVIALDYVCDSDFEDNEPKAEFIESLECILRPEQYIEAEERFADYKISLCQYAALQGMKLAISIMNDTYVGKA